MAENGRTWQLLDSSGKINKDAREMLETKVSSDQEATVVAVIGCQNTGKSTLLNEVFSLDFVTGRRVRRKGSESTKGVWVGFPELQSPFVVLDTEGLDGRVTSSGENLTEFAKKMINVLIAVADIILVNIWYSDVGRFSAANYHVLRYLFEEYTKLYGEEESDLRRTGLVFVVRDSDEEDLDEITQVLTHDVHQLWQKASISGESKYQGFDDYFDVFVFGVPHYKYCEHGFRAASRELLHRLSDEAHQPAYISTTFSKELCGTDFAAVLSAAWNSPVSETLGRRELLALYYCDLAASRAQHALAADLQKWHKTVQDGGLVENFGEVSSTAMNKNLREYDDFTFQFRNSKCRMTKRADVVGSYMIHTRDLFKRQVVFLQNRALEDFKAALTEKMEQNNDPLPPLEERELMAATDREFVRKADDLVMPLERYSYADARQELAGVLQDHTHKLRELFVQRKAKGPPLPPPKKPFSCWATCGVTYRPKGYGNFNFQLAQSYRRHGVQVNVLNDNDGSGQIKEFAVQPSLNCEFDIL
eukprot:Rmarinus@m.15105